jgi:methylated-DNA-[protein]-cysteine S-methyltransferase
MIEVYAQKIEGIWFAMALNEQKIVTSSFDVHEKTALNNVLSNLPFNTPFQVFHEPTAQAKTALLTLKAIYDGKTPQAKLNLHTSKLPAYTKKVLKATLAIPVGYVTSYGAMAKAVGGGARAVGNAMACNLFPPVVPCHRVVKSDLTLGGYGAGGLKVKLEFLNREKRGFIEPKEIDVDGACLKVFPVEYVLEKFALS